MQVVDETVGEFLLNVGVGKAFQQDSESRGNKIKKN